MIWIYAAAVQFYSLKYVPRLPPPQPPSTGRPQKESCGSAVALDHFTPNMHRFGKGYRPGGVLPKFGVVTHIKLVGGIDGTAHLRGERG